MSLFTLILKLMMFKVVIDFTLPLFLSHLLFDTLKQIYFKHLV